jgi:ribose 5-phosphate isomerase A
MPQVHPGKQAAGEKATDYIEQGMILGLGTGSTAYWTIEKIGQMVREGLHIRAIATSEQSQQQAEHWNIPLVSWNEIDHIDIDIDGADEVDRNFNLIKGGGGALLREKIIAFASRKMIVVADESKRVERLGKFPLPIEVIRFGWEMTARKLQQLNSKAVLRMKDGQPFITDNGNFILDCSFGNIPDPGVLNEMLNGIPGVVENGLFVNRCDTLIVGYEDGSAEAFSKAAAN